MTHRDVPMRSATDADRDMGEPLPRRLGDSGRPCAEVPGWGLWVGVLVAIPIFAGFLVAMSGDRTQTMTNSNWSRLERPAPALPQSASPAPQAKGDWR